MAQNRRKVKPKVVAKVTPRRQRGVPRRIALALGGSSLLLLVALLILRALHVPLGEPGRTVYGYSATAGDRLLLDTWPVAFAAGLIAAGIWWIGDTRRARRAIARGALALGVAGLVVWTYASPPLAVAQHILNLISPGQDGAFVFETHTAPTARAYLRTFESRVARSPDEMRSTRVISNPPGMTLLAYGVRATTPYARWLDPLLMQGIQPDPAIAVAVRFGLALTALWGLSAIFSYRLGRLFLSPAGAAAFAVVVTLNPTTVNFTPGKDPAQLLTISAMLWAWFAAWRLGPGWRADVMAYIAGLILIAGTICGLIHLWVAAVVVVACAWAGGPRSIVRPAVHAAAGIVVALLVIRFGLGWNAPHGLLAVYRRFGQVQPLIYPDRGFWLVIGLPIFLLFLSPGVIVPAWLAARPAYGSDRAGRHPIGRPLLVATLAVMALTYFVGVSYELPRLWVAFLPTLTLGAMAASPLFCGSGRHARPALLAIVVAQVAFTAIQFSLLDARGSEQRIRSGRMFSVAPPLMEAPRTYSRSVDERDIGRGIEYVTLDTDAISPSRGVPFSGSPEGSHFASGRGRVSLRDYR